MQGVAKVTPMPNLSIAGSLPRARRVIVDSSSLFLRLPDAACGESPEIVFSQWRRRCEEPGFEATVYHGIDRRLDFLKSRVVGERAFTTYRHLGELFDRVRILEMKEPRSDAEKELLLAQIALLDVYRDAPFIEEYLDEKKDGMVLFEAVCGALQKYANRISHGPGVTDVSLLASAVMLSHFERNDTVGFATDDEALKTLTRRAPEALAGFARKYGLHLKDNLWLYSGLSGQREKLWDSPPRKKYARGDGRQGLHHIRREYLGMQA